MARITADANGRPAPAPRGTGLTAVSATSPLVLSLNGSVLSGSIDLSAIPPKVTVQKDGAEVGTRPAINLLEGANVSITVTDDGPNGRVDVEVAASGLPVPGDTVVDETAFGLAPEAGVATEYSRADHSHGTPADPGGGGGIDALTEGRIPVKGAIDLEDSRIVQTASDALVIRTRETSPTDYGGLQIGCGVAGRSTIVAIQEDGGLDTSPALVLSATSLSGGASVSLGDGDTAAVLAAVGMMGTGQVSAEVGRVEVTAQAGVDDMAEVFLGTQGDLEDPCTVTVNAAGVAIATGGTVTVNGDEVVTANVLAALILRGTGNPEGAVAATQGTIYLDSTGGLGATLYVKEDGGTGNTGWVVK